MEICLFQRYYNSLNLDKIGALNMSILFHVRKIYPYFSLFSDVLSCIIERAITSLSKDELIFLWKNLSIKHPINRKALICMNIWNAITHIPINFRKRSDYWQLRIYPARYSYTQNHIADIYAYMKRRYTRVDKF